MQICIYCMHIYSRILHIVSTCDPTGNAASHHETGPGSLEKVREWLWAQHSAQ